MGKSLPLLIYHIHSFVLKRQNTNQTQRDPHRPIMGKWDKVGEGRDNSRPWADGRPDRCSGQWGESVSREEPESTQTVMSLWDLAADPGIQEPNLQVYLRRVNQEKGTRFSSLKCLVLSCLLSKHMNYPSIWKLKYFQIFLGTLITFEFTERSEAGTQVQQLWHSKGNKCSLGPIWEGKWTWSSKGWGSWERGSGNSCFLLGVGKAGAVVSHMTFVALSAI